MVNVTVKIENENRMPQEICLTHNSNTTLMSSLLEKGLVSGSFCGGNGKCQRCFVQFLQAAPVPTNIERKTFTPRQLREGYRLACMAKPGRDCVVRLAFFEAPSIEILTDMVRTEELQGTLINVSEKKDPAGQQENGKETCLIAVDLGTTTIAMQLRKTGSGQIIDTYCAMNPQRAYGADVLSRIQAANTGDAEILKNSVRTTLLKGVSQFYHILQQKVLRQRALQQKESQQEIPLISCMCIAGNTTMEHLLMGLSTEGLGRSPFVPAELGLQKCTLADLAKGSAFDSLKVSELPVYVVPGISAFVGGDIVAGLYHCNLLNYLQGRKTEENMVLFIDLGTNGEMAITNGSRMIVTATAAGPAFEGGAGAAVPGSDMIAATASLLGQGMIDETGLLADALFENGVTVSGHIHLTQKDIRDLQMAKAAVRAGVETLCAKMGNLPIAKVYLAGGFGYYLNVNAAVEIGLLPEGLRAHTQAAGNTSLAGAFDIGRDLCTGKIREETLMEMLHRIECINLAKQENFEALYLGNLNFPNPMIFKD